MKRIIVGISGASGIPIATKLLEMLGQAGVERHVIISPSAKRTALSEVPDLNLESLSEQVHAWKDIGASIASGSFTTDGMIVVPCSVKTLSQIAYGIGENLICRAADVTLKERRRLVLCVRETPFHLGHLRAMTQATEAGAIIAPPVPAFYAAPATIDDIVSHTASRLLQLVGVEAPGREMWAGERAGMVRADKGLVGLI
ncbi:UbiX family flavin prenyltransferase [Microbacterium sp. NPDC096154]|uniref:UbiX family flavin prenyltransferase n=1 Tax=Microbacterium sp. NPDC096154 TaxID=3155549 RepID=UPI003330CD04